VPITTVELVIALVVTAFAAAVQGTLGFGFAVVSVPVLALVDPVLVPVPQLLVAAPLAMAAFWRERHEVDLTGMGWIVAGRVPGAAIGVLLLGLVAGGGRLLDVLIALIVLSAVVVYALHISVRRTPLTKLLAGVASGTTGLVSSIGGPPLALLYADERGATVRSTLGAVFTIGIGITIVARALAGEISGDDLRISALLLPAQLAGFAASSRLRHHVEGGLLRGGILVVSAAAAIALLLRAVG
jgi:hypothetical protein